jgi:hypothetical protein
MADARTLLSSDVGWRTYSSYFNDPLAQAVFKELGIGRALVATIRTLPRISRAFLEARRMTTKWPWLPPNSYNSRTLADLRRQFDIRVI